MGSFFCAENQKQMGRMTAAVARLATPVTSEADSPVQLHKRFTHPLLAVQLIFSQKSTA